MLIFVTFFLFIIFHRFFLDDLRSGFLSLSSFFIAAFILLYIYHTTTNRPSGHTANCSIGYIRLNSDDLSRLISWTWKNNVEWAKTEKKLFLYAILTDLNGGTGPWDVFLGIPNSIVCWGVKSFPFVNHSNSFQK